MEDRADKTEFGARFVEREKGLEQAVNASLRVYKLGADRLVAANDKYRFGELDMEPWLFHGEKHVSNVVNSASLLLDATDNRIEKNGRADKFPPDEQDDPLGLYRQVDQYCRGQEGLRDLWEGLIKDNKPGEMRRYCRAVYVSAAAVHENGNTTAKVDWSQVKAGREKEEGVVEGVGKIMKYKGAEDVAAPQYVGFAGEFAQELGFDTPEKLSLAQELGSKFILQTVFNPKSFAEGGGLAGLSIMDQVVSATLNPAGFRETEGLIREAHVRAADNDPTYTDFPISRDKYFFGFIPDRLNLAETEGLLKVEEYYKLVDELRQDKPGEFAHRIGTTEGVVQKMGSWERFVQKNLNKKKELAGKVRPGKVGPDGVMEDVSIRAKEAYGSNAGEEEAVKAKIAAASREYKGQFWISEAQPIDQEKQVLMA